MRKASLQIFASLFLLGGAVFAQQTNALSLASQAPLIGLKDSPRNYLMPGDVSFAHIAVGGPWMTQFFLVNMSPNSIKFVLSFSDDNGVALSVPIAQPGGGYSWMSAGQATLAPFGGINFTALNINSNTQTGQAILSYDHSLGYIGGFAVFQGLSNAGQVVSEATVPVSGTDSLLYLPFFNNGGYNTGIALANPSSSSTYIVIQAMDENGKMVVNDGITLPPYGHTAFTLASWYPALRNLAGNLYVQSSSGWLSAVGLRFAPSGTFTTIPILNWSGMY